MAANTFAKIEIFFQIGEIKMGIFVKSYHYDMWWISHEINLLGYVKVGYNV